MTTPIKIKRSGTASSTPSSLDHGELAINYADATLFWKDSANVIKSFVFQAYASATHKSTHATGGSDALTPADIGAAPAASPAITGNATFEASSGVPVTITNTGTGNSFVVNDIAGDTTPFVVDASGNVGIWNSTPLAAIDASFASDSIPGSGFCGMRLHRSGSATTAFGCGIMLTALDDKGGIIAADGAQNIRFFNYTGSSIAERVRIDSSGNLLVGTTTAASRLTVNGVITVSATSGSAGSYLPSLTFSGDANTGFGQVSGQSDSASIFTAGHERVRVDSSGNIEAGPNKRTIGVSSRMHISADNANWGTPLCVVCDSVGRGPVVVSADYSPNPDVGSQLYINASTGGFTIGCSSPGNSALGSVTFSASQIVTPAGTAAAPALVASGDANTGVFFPTGGDRFAISTDGLERLRINNLGNVGIGTNSPASRLDVSGVITVSATSGSAGSYLPSVTFSGDANTGFGQVSGQSDTASIFTAGHERVRVKSTGAVRCVPLTGTDPTGEVGDIYYNSTMGTLRTYRGSSWVSVPPRPWDISNGVLTHEFSVAGQETQPAGIAFKPDGSKMYIIGQAGDDVNEYDLATPWDISTATYLQAFSVSGKETAATAVYFRPTGLKMYVIGVSSDSVHEYDLSTAWDVSTATFLQSFSVSAKEGSPLGLVFKPDGLKFWICGADSDSVHEYSLSTAWDISTATFAQSLSVSAQDTQSSGLAFRPDGLRMYMTGYTTDTTNEYILSTAWDISTAAFSQRLSIADTIPIGTTFSPDGTRLYVVGFTGQKVLQYWIA